MLHMIDMPPVRMVLLSSVHMHGLREIVTDPDVLRFTRVPDPPPEDFAETWLARYDEGRRDGTREAFAVLDADGTFCGVAVAPSIARDERTAELGYVIHPAARGRGVATQTLRLLTDWAFAELDPARLELLISVDNEASKRVAQRNGYTYEGTLRGLYFKQDTWEDTEMWSKLPTDR